MSDHGKTIMGYSSLTEFEFDGLSAKYGFADGHAYQDLDVSQAAILDRLPTLWTAATRLRQREVEHQFASAFYRLAGQISAVDRDNFRVCTAASQSIDLALAWVARSGLRVALIEPTFDNLALIARRWRVPLVPVPESALHGNLENLDPDAFDVLFLVSPNNPTGTTVDATQLAGIADWCCARLKTLVVDFCFRFFSTMRSDCYKVLLESGVAFIAIEDTGKTWATMDMKASLISYAPQVAAEIEEIFHEIFLGVSPFCLLVLTEFIGDTQARGFEATLWQLVAENRRRFREVIDGSILRIDPKAVTSPLALEWVEIEHPYCDDLSLTEHLKRSGVACLPGRFFHWNSKAYAGHRNLRFSLLKPKRTFEHGLPALRRALDSFPESVD